MAPENINIIENKVVLLSSYLGTA